MQGLSYHLTLSLSNSLCHRMRGHFYIDCCRMAERARIIFPHEILPALTESSKGDVRTCHAPVCVILLSEHSGDLY